MNILLSVVLPVVLAVIGSGGMWTYLDHHRQVKDAERRQISAEEQAERDIVKALARFEIVRTCLGYIETGDITVEEADALTDLFVPYETLGGNGNGKRLYDQAMKLPRRNGRSAR